MWSEDVETGGEFLTLMVEVLTGDDSLGIRISHRLDDQAEECQRFGHSCERRNTSHIVAK